MRKKTLSALLCTVAAMAVLTGCGGDKKETAAAVADGLYEVLWLVGSAERFGARSMSHTMTEDGVDFFVTYGWQIIVEQQEALMERLEYNGEKVIGYEENEV